MFKELCSSIGHDEDLFGADVIVVLIVSVALVSLHLIAERVLRHQLLQQFPRNVVFDTELGCGVHSQFLQDVVSDNLPGGILTTRPVEGAVGTLAGRRRRPRRLLKRVM